ncbi:glucuronosyltransferase [Hwanghaeella grinnelliae]|uniref:Glucuronosyltransferase n=1 Tax=Hwanghaeella grinnelliae TaxID=2500179 RepID=A0A3S2W746_9PROT|nr:glycosyltransferase [Hwanghaeella grinnelliae]RVU34118.1 glucuronosyltransferase [Hwanghaeella grinnelliae]
MIFVTVGTQLAFPRLMEAFDTLAPGLGEDVVAQVGPDTGNYPNLKAQPNVAPDEFERLFTEARLVVGHAGVGTILSAKRFGTPLVLMPRRHALGEHRNDHQLATAKAVEKLPGVYIAWQADELAGLLVRDDLKPMTNDESPTHSALIGRLKAFIETA